MGWRGGERAAASAGRANIKYLPFAVREQHVGHLGDVVHCAELAIASFRLPPQARRRQ